MKGQGRESHDVAIAVPITWAVTRIGGRADDPDDGTARHGRASIGRVMRTRDSHEATGSSARGGGP